MSREIDWRVHELMGNDLTGWEWATDDSDVEQAYAIKHVGYDAEYMTIPHYSTTWEGAGLVMEACRQQDWEVTMLYYESLRGWIYSAGLSTGEQYAYLAFTDPSAPMALAKAFISAMEERA